MATAYLRISSQSPSSPKKHTRLRDLFVHEPIHIYGVGDYYFLHTFMPIKRGGQNTEVKINTFTHKSQETLIRA